MNRTLFIVILAIFIISLFHTVYGLSFGGGVSPDIKVDNGGTGNTNNSSNNANNVSGSNNGTTNYSNSANTNHTISSNSVSSNSNNNGNVNSNSNSNTNSNSNSDSRTVENAQVRKIYDNTDWPFFDLVIDGNEKQVVSADITAKTNVTLLAEKKDQNAPVLVAYLSDGTEIEVNILPDFAYSIMEQNFSDSCRIYCSIKLKEVANEGGNLLVYEIKAKKEVGFSFLKIGIPTNVYVDAQTGEIVNV